jgi:hypothetical protein
VVRGSGNNVRTAPLTTPFTQSVQSQGHYSHFTLPTTLHRAYHMATCVPYDQPSVRHASPIFGPSRPLLPSSSRLLNDGLCSDLVLIILSAIIRYEGLFVSQCIRRLIALDGVEGPSAHNFWHASFQIRWSSMHVMTSGGPLAGVPNSSPLQARFKESTPMSGSCDLFYEGPQKCHPHALVLDELIWSFFRDLVLAMHVRRPSRDPLGLLAAYLL